MLVRPLLRLPRPLEAGRDKYTKKEQELMFAQLDSDADGKVTEDELMNYMRRRDSVQSAGNRLLMHQLDLDGNGVFEAKEFRKTIGRALLRKVPLP